MTDSEWRAFVMAMRHARFEGPDGFMSWLLTNEGRDWFEHWPTMPVHTGWGQG